MVINSAFVRWLGVAGITICPFIFLDSKLSQKARARVLRHEDIHWWQQLLFGVIGAIVGTVVWGILSWPPQAEMIATFSLGAIEGWVAGQLLWRFLYLFCLPVYWNPCRRYWETAAYRVDGFSDDEIRKILSEPPYRLRC
jgi:hypothetical protein